MLKPCRPWGRQVSAHIGKNKGDITPSSTRRPFPQRKSTLLILLLPLHDSLDSPAFGAGAPTQGLAGARYHFTAQLYSLVPDVYILQMS